MEQTVPLSSYRRSYERFKVEASATLIIDKNLEIPSILTDLSSRGAGVVSNDSLKVNEKIKVIISAPFFFQNPLYREAKVVWCKRIDENLCQSGLDFGGDNLIDFA